MTFLKLMSNPLQLHQRTYLCPIEIREEVMNHEWEKGEQHVDPWICNS